VAKKRGSEENASYISCGLPQWIPKRLARVVAKLATSYGRVVLVVIDATIETSSKACSWIPRRSGSQSMLPSRQARRRARGFQGVLVVIDATIETKKRGWGELYTTTPFLSPRRRAPTALEQLSAPVVSLASSVHRGFYCNLGGSPDSPHREIPIPDSIAVQYSLTLDIAKDGLISTRAQSIELHLRSRDRRYFRSKLRHCIQSPQ